MTPGFWLQSNRRAVRTHNHPDRFWEQSAHSANHLELVVTGHGASAEEAEANCRAAAAAPAMLKALRDTYLALLAMDTVTRINFQRELCQLRDVIALVEGRPEQVVQDDYTAEAWAK